MTYTHAPQTKKETNRQTNKPNEIIYSNQEALTFSPYYEKKTALRFVYVTPLSPNDDQNIISPHIINIMSSMLTVVQGKPGTYDKERFLQSTGSEYEIEYELRQKQEEVTPLGTQLD